MRGAGMRPAQLRVTEPAAKCARRTTWSDITGIVWQRPTNTPEPAGRIACPILLRDTDGFKGVDMARYGKAASEKVHEALHEEKKGTLKSGKSGRKVTDPKQAIAIGLSEARKKGAKVPPPK